MTKPEILEKPQIPVLLKALRGWKTERTPIWLMRQAGRYLPEYRDLRAKAGGFLDLCFNPEWAAEVTLQPLARFDLDAAIIFSDILVVPLALGQDLSFMEGEGPQLPPLQSPAEWESLSDRNFREKLAPVYAALKLTRKKLPRDKALIGFTGAPWTLACYMLQGYGDGKFQVAQDIAAKYPQEFQALLGRLAEAVAIHLIYQLEAGADAVQIFDSWAGLRQGDDFKNHVIAPTKKIVEIVRRKYPQAPIIGFPRGSSDITAYARDTGISCLGLDQHTNFSKAPTNICVQGNLDPEILLAGGMALDRAVDKIMVEAKDRPFIFNLGHGVIKETPPAHVEQLIKAVRRHE